MLTVYLNGKKILADVVDIDVHAGWIDIEDLSVVASAATDEIVDLNKLAEDKVEDVGPIKLPTKRLFGYVSIKAEPDELD